MAQEINFQQPSIYPSQNKEISEALAFSKISKPCERLQAVLKAVVQNKHHVLEVANFSDLSSFLQESNLIDEGNKITTFGKIILSYSSGDVRFHSFCIGLFKELYKLPKNQSILIEIMLSLDRGCNRIIENPNYNHIDKRFFLFLELIGIIGKINKLDSNNSYREITRMGILIFQDFEIKINESMKIYLTINGNVVFDSPGSTIDQNFTDKSKGKD